MADDMSLQEVQPERTFYRRVQYKCEQMTEILKPKANSTFVCSIKKFVDEFDDHHNTREQFIEQCKLLENARLGYKKDDLSAEEARGIIYKNGNATVAIIYDIVEDLCVCIEEYLEQRLFTPWPWTDKTREGPEFPAARQTMKNLISYLKEQADGNQQVNHHIDHLQENFEYVISSIKWCKANPGLPLPVDGSHHQPQMQEAHCTPVESLLQSLASLSDATPD